MFIIRLQNFRVGKEVRFTRRAKACTYIKLTPKYPQCFSQPIELAERAVNSAFFSVLVRIQEWGYTYLRLFGGNAMILFFFPSRCINSVFLVYVAYIGDIYFFEVNTKYISSHVLKISVISRVLVKLLMFSTHEMNIFGIYRK